MFRPFFFIILCLALSAAVAAQPCDSLFKLAGNNAKTGIAAAIKNYTAIISQKCANQAAAYAKRGRLYYHIEEYTPALDDLKQSLALNNGDTDVYILIAGIYEDDIEDDNHLDSAELYLTKLINNNPSHKTLVLQRAEFYRRTEQNGKAVEDYLAGLKTGGGDEETVCNLATCYDAEKDWDNALRYYTASIAIKPNGNALVNRGRVYRKINKTQLAIADEESAIKLDTAYAQAYLILGNCYLAMGDTAMAGRNYSKGLAQRPLGQIQSLLQRQLTKIGMAHAIPAIMKVYDDTAFVNAAARRNKMKLEAAARMYTQQIELCRTCYQPYINRGFTWYNLQQTEKARQDMDAAILVSPDKVQTLYTIADVFFEAEDYGNAFATYTKIVNLDPGSAGAWYKMGRCKWLERIKILQDNKVEDYATDTAFKTHLKAEILVYYDKAIYLDSVKNWKLYTDRPPGGMDAAEDMHTKYEYWYFRGLFKSNFYDYQGALNDYETSILIHPTINAYYYAAYIAKKVNQKQKACNYIQQWAMMINPSETVNVFDKHATADAFCKELGVEKK